VGVPQCGSRGFGSEDNRGGDRGEKYRVHMYVVIDQSSPLPISIFLSLYLLFPPPYTRTSNQLAYMQACMVSMYACVHIGVHCWQDGVSLRGSNTDGNPSHGSVGWKPLVRVCHVLHCFPIETREASRTGLPFVGVYTCVYLRMHMHGYICMRVCGCRLSKLYG